MAGTLQAGCEMTPADPQIYSLFSFKGSPKHSRTPCACQPQMKEKYERNNNVQKTLPMVRLQVTIN